ncbi:MAG: hypothetical protein QOD51_3092 [Candidatus Eremiobacteraeota bacterium]|nr:hypothetical protein [Candidatus Eremiobacteraeota bacterium]
MDDDRLNHARLNRRGALGMLGALGAALAARPGAAAGAPALQATAAQTLDCVLSPAIEEGPFFVDERLNRSDLTTGTSDPGVKLGVPLKLVFRVHALNGSACAPLSGAHVDLWHTDATGIYSDVAPLKTVGQRFLRGYQITGSDGGAAFSTIFPGWYPGRTPHIHVKVRTFSPAGAVKHAFTSQLYFDEAVANAVYARAPYAGRGNRDMTNARDGLFDRAMIVSLAPSGRGYSGTFNLGLRMG